ncbi:MipA/OmpV family protein [Arsukibacterium sp.]|uniref:MipA/OmpV family protein n=1 Tax=Arsukibacterium sp. TaxID=1977258 RepID=UPI002FDA5E21
MNRVNAKQLVRRLSIILGCSLPLYSATAAENAQPDAQYSYQQAAPALPLWEAGLIGISINQLAYPGAAEQVQRSLIVPYLVYRGNWFRADRENLGFRAIKTDTIELDLGFAGALGAGKSDIAAREGMAKLGNLVEAGPRLRWTLTNDFLGARLRADFPLRAVFDINDSLRFNGVSFEPSLNADVISEAGIFYNLRLSTLFGSEQLNEYFYQVNALDATAERPEYDAKAGYMALRGSLSIGKRFSKNWRAFGFGRYEWTQGAANKQSPLMLNSGGWSVGIGVTYVFAESSRLAGE